MSNPLPHLHAIIAVSGIVLLAIFAGSAVAETTPSERQLQELYRQAVVSDNHATEQFFGKNGTTLFHKLEKVTCKPVSGSQTTQACKVRVEITSVGLGRHQLQDRIVLQQSEPGNWRLISGIFN